VKNYRRTLSDEEKLQLRRGLPWFGKSRQARLADIEQGNADVYEFEVNRIWDINGCRPPCCPYTILFETTDDLFVYTESWDELEREDNLNHSLLLASTPNKRLVKLHIQGQIKHDDRLREWSEFFEINGDGQWRLLKKSEIPPHVLATLDAV